MTPLQFATAIGEVESNGDIYAPLGDGGRAFGRFQQHFDWIWEWAKRLALAPQLNETVDSFQNRLVQGYYSFHSDQSLTPVEIAVSYHRGHICHEGDSDWLADDYAQRFTDAAAKV